MGEILNDDEQFDILSETDSSDETQILKVEHFAKCFYPACNESFIRLDDLYKHVINIHSPVRFTCHDCLMCTENFYLMMKHKMHQHIGRTVDDLYQCFYCLMFSSDILDELVDHLMSCVIMNNDKDGHKMKTFMKSLEKREAKEKRPKKIQIDQVKGTLRVDKKTGEVYFANKRVTEYPDKLSTIVSKKRRLQSALLSKRAENSKAYELYCLDMSEKPRLLLSPTGNIAAFVNKAMHFSAIYTTKSDK